ncbi:MAG TPA: orotidine-5'-phosphate decarboxylase, partial [Candidatus Limnocylindrales bacterium]|nr:orotidine-5'-phosphate decarboxylase [Candidatus Limnocylindrales bacterium]
GVEAFATLLLEAAGPFVAAVKPNLAFFEAFGSSGIAALERIRARVPSGLPVVMDAKRGDIGTTAARQAAALFDGLGADAVTVNPYLGEEAVLPLLERLDRFAYVLCRTSNPGAGELQGLIVAEEVAQGGGDARGDDGPDAHTAPAEPLYARVARRAATWGPGETVGLVVGATAPTELAAIRVIAPGLTFLVPGVGAQGGDEAAVLRDGPARAAPAAERAGGGLLVNVSRGISGAVASASGDPSEAVAAAARDWSRRLPVLG